MTGEGVIVIVTGTYREAQEYAQAHAMPSSWWIHALPGGHTLEGARIHAIVVTGTWFQRADLRELDYAIQSASFGRHSLMDAIAREFQCNRFVEVPRDPS